MIPSEGSQFGSTHPGVEGKSKDGDVPDQLSVSALPICPQAFIFPSEGVAN